MTILPTLALRSFVGFDNLFNELESISNQKQSSFPAHDIIRISDDEYEITLAASGFNKKDISCLLYTSPSPRDMRRSRMPSSA